MFNPNDPLHSKYSEESAEDDSPLDEKGNPNIPPPAYYHPPDFRNPEQLVHTHAPTVDGPVDYREQPAAIPQQQPPYQPQQSYWTTPGSSSSGGSGGVNSRQTSAGTIDSSGGTMSGYSFGSSDFTASSAGGGGGNGERRNSSAEHELYRLMKPHQAATSMERSRIKRARNTEAARRSRARKTERLAELETRVEQLSKQSDYIAQLEQRCEQLTSRNQELEQRVESLQKELNDLKVFMVRSSGCSEKSERSDDDTVSSSANQKNDEFLRHDRTSKGI
ncbi:hypothetical protein TRICI_006812 [Trichomonascus ciferrii]|uniref:BZIP domain-containing protein n=1 Tax=Trichomonascus ciferrii TaxID=44093 RepID=A0A642UHF9_9ASCO|nr:hypothetical protein TRICI_006812 [Trichomonascus ciferrii]